MSSAVSSWLFAWAIVVGLLLLSWIIVHRPVDGGWRLIWWRAGFSTAFIAFCVLFLVAFGIL